MKSFILTILFSFFSINTFAQTECNKLPEKSKQICWENSVKEREDALYEYVDAIRHSSYVPDSVKIEIVTRYNNFSKNIYSACPDAECVSRAMMFHIEEIYNRTRQYTIPK